MLANRLIAIEHHYPYTAELCKNYLATGGVPDFQVTISQDEILQEYEENNGVFSLPMCESACVHRKISLKLLEYATFIMHAAVVQVDGNGYGFLAHSGVGKTTHTKLWLEHFGDRATVVNGDKPMIGYEDGVFYAYGTPWQGKEGLGANTRAPLKGLALLERGEENTIRLAKQEEVSRRIFDQVLLPTTANELELFMKLLNQLLKTVPIYMLTCNQEIQAAAIASEKMCEG